MHLHRPMHTRMRIAMPKSPTKTPIVTLSSVLRPDGSPCAAIGLQSTLTCLDVLLLLSITKAALASGAGAGAVELGLTLKSLPLPM